VTEPPHLRGGHERTARALAWAVPPSVRLLGRPRVERDGDSVEPPVGKAWALLLVLAARGTWVERSELVYLFWPDQDETQARANLRKLLSRNVPALPLAERLESEPTRLRWLVDTDLAEFRQALAQGRLAQALASYTGPFLDGVRADGMPMFEEWVDAEREAVAQAWRDAGSTLAAQAAAEGRVEDAVRVLRSLVDADPLDEDALQAYLRALSAAGRPAAGLDAYRAFVERLGRELGEAPTRATRELADALAAERSHVAVATAAAAAPAPSAPRPAASRALPRSGTPFVGREAERLRIAEQIADAGCRLLTLTAPGGFGKTRLALAAAEDLATRFADGVTFVPLAPVADVDKVPFALAEALGITISGAREPLDQVVSALSDRELVLVLDNVEHLRSDLGWLSAILDGGAGVRVLATSRERLDLRDEWRFELRGLRLPGDGEAPAEADAVRLFLQTVGREHAAGIVAEEMEAVVRLCRALDGMPLALELAAGWVGTMRVDELVHAVERDLGVLASTRSDVPERHRSLTVVFEASLARLPFEDRAGFEALAVFPGSFDRVAAERIAGASARALRDLASRSLLAAAGDGRFRLHELLRQYAASRLHADPERELALREAHAHYYAAWVIEAGAVLLGPSPAAMLAHLDLERDNVLAAFRHAVATRALETVGRMAYALSTYFIQRTRYAAGAAAFGEAAAALEGGTPEERAVAGGLLVRIGYLEFRRGRYDRARALAERAPALWGDGGHATDRIEAVGLLGACAGVQGDYDASWEHFDRALAMARAAGQPNLIAIALNNIAITEKQLGLFRQAEARYRESLALNRSRGASLAAARNLNNLGMLLLADDRPAEAEAVLQEGLDLARSIDAWQVVPHVLAGLAKTELVRGEHGRAREHAEEAWRLTRAAGARGIIGSALTTLALAAQAQGDEAGADAALAGALTDARETANDVALLTTLATAGRVRSQRGDHRAAVMALSLVRDDPRLEHALRTEIGPEWRASAATLGPAGVAAAQAEAERAGVDEVLARLVPAAAATTPT
jgi:predicted ATPase/DNA-binding SARP family transcriptional activator